MIGASFIGLEVAASLRARGLEVRVVGLERVPLERVLGAEVGGLVRAIHEEHGVRFHLGRSPRAIEPDRVILDDGSALEADLVDRRASACGRAPSSPRRPGLPVDRGIVVDAELRASARASARRRRRPLARRAAAASACASSTGWWRSGMGERGGAEPPRERRALPRRPPFFWSAHYDLTINYVGHAESWDRVDVDGDLASRDAAVHYLRGDELLAVATLGRDRYALEVARRFEEE